MGPVESQIPSMHCSHRFKLTPLTAPFIAQVLDEADRLLTATFAPELSYLFEVLPKERQTCLFTATLTPAVERVADATPRPGKQKPFVHRMTAAYVVSRPAAFHGC